MVLVITSKAPKDRRAKVVGEFISTYVILNSMCYVYYSTHIVIKNELIV